MFNTTTGNDAAYLQLAYNVRFYAGGNLGIRAGNHLDKHLPYIVRPLAEWASMWGLKVATLAARAKDGWPARALRLPEDQGWLFLAERDGITFGGRTQSLKDWAREIGVAPRSLLARLRTRCKGPHDLDGLAAALTERKVIAGEFVYMGHKASLREHCLRLGLNYSTVRSRVAGRRVPGSVEWMYPPMNLVSALAAGRRKERADKGYPNPKRSTKHWSPPAPKNRPVEPNA